MIQYDTIDGGEENQPFSTPEEHESAELLLKDSRARFNPKCLFESEAWGTGTASIANEITNLVKNIVGSGGLSLPAAVAAFGNAPSALFPAVLLIFVMGTINAYSFSLLGRVCAVTKSKTYFMAWDRTMGRRHGRDELSSCVNIVVAGKAVLGTWSFSIVIASTCQPFLQWIGLSGTTRSQILWFITGFVLLPLCLFQRIENLAFFSLIGQFGTIWTMLTMAIRYFDGSYAENGRYYGDLDEDGLPLFGQKGFLSFFSPQSLVLVSILSTGFVAHYNAPRYYFELKDHTTGRFNVVVNLSFLFSALIYVVVSSLGFLTFGENSRGFILDSYSYRDPLASIARVGIALSVIFSYPLLFHGGRDSLLAIFGHEDPSDLELKIVTVLLLFSVTFLAILVSDLTFVLSFSGSTMSALLIYIFPPMMFGALVKNCTCMLTYRTNWEVKESVAMMYFGTVVGVLGVVVTVVRTFS